MADLSSLSDEQLGVYRDLLAKKQPQIPGTEKTGLPAAGSAPIPRDLQNKPNGLLPGANEGLEGYFNEGARQLGEAIPAFANKRPATGISDLVEGGIRVATPFAAPAMLAAPIATAGAVGGGYAASKAGQGIARHFGASPETERAVGDVASIPGAMLGGSGAGLVSRMAAPLAESALGIRGAQREYGATPGKAILQDTSGVRPATVEKSANAKLADLTNELESSARRSMTPVSMAPARKIISNAISSARAGNSIPRELLPLQEHLETPHPGFGGAIDQPPAPLVPTPSAVLGPNGQPLVTMVPGKLPPARIAPTQSPSDYLGIKRRFATDFTNFRPGASTDESVGLANRVSHQMSQDFNKAVPGGAELNQRIQSLIPVAKRAHASDLNSGPVENILNRATRPTGGLIPFLAGLKEGGPLGGGIALTGQEMLGSPAVKMIGARGLNAVGQPLAPVPSAVAPGLVRKRDQEP